MPSDSNIEALLASLTERQRAADQRLDKQDQTLASRLDKQDQTLASVADSLKTLTRIELQAQATHTGFTEFRDEMREFRKERLSAEKDLESRIDELERRMPAVEETSGWVKKAAALIAASVVAAFVALLKLPK